MDLPKPLVEVAGEPFLVHQLRLLSSQGFVRAVLCVGHLGEKIEDTIGTTCEGVTVEYSYDGPGLDGTLGAIRRAVHLLGSRFLVMYGDTYLRLDFADFYRSWLGSHLPGGMTVLRNDDLWDKSNVYFAGGRVLSYDKKHPSAEMHWIDYGLSALTADALDAVPTDCRDLSELQTALARKGSLFGYEVFQRFYEIGTPEALDETSAFLLQHPPR